MCMNFFLTPFKIRSIFHLRVKMTWIAAKIITGAWMCQLADKWRVFAQAPPPPLLDAYAQHWGPSFKLRSILSVVLDFGVPSERGLLSHAQLPTLGLVKVFGTCRRLIHCAPKRTNFRIWSKVLQLKDASLSSSFRTEFSFACGWSSKKNFSQLVFRRFTFLQLKIYGRFSIHKYFFIQDWSQACDDIGRDPTAITFVLRVWRHIWDLVCLVEWISFETKLQRLWNVS